MYLRRFLFTLFAVALSIPAFGQSLAKTFTLTAANQCASIGTSQLPTVGIDVSGTFSLTLTPYVVINGQTKRASQVTPSSSNTAQATITTAGGYTDPFVGGYDTFLLCVTSYSSGSVVIWLNPSPALNGSLMGGSGGVATIPISISPTVATSETNECNNVTVNGAGSPIGTVTAGAVLRSVTAAGVGHDVMCVILTSTRASDVGGIVFPYVSSSSPNSAASQAQDGDWEISGTVARLFMTNTSGSNTSRRNNFSWRSCPIVAGCGTDWSWIEDNASAGNEDMTWLTGTSQAVLYVTGNCPYPGCVNTFNSSGGPQFLIDDGTHTATTNPEFGLVGGHLAHGTTGSNATDTWGTATCATSTATVTFSTAFANATYQVLLTDDTTVGGARVSTKNTGSFVITCTGASDSVDYIVLGNPY